MLGRVLVKAGLAPVLLAQGLFVRRVTPRLPEPPGPRHGSDGDGPALRVLILGDSAAAGVGASSQAQALSGRLVAGLSRHFHVSWTLIARTGHGIRDVLQIMRDRPAETFDVVVVSIGVNDVTGNLEHPAWLELQSELVGLLSRQFGATQILLSNLPPMRAFPSLPQPLRWYLGSKAMRFNRALGRLAERDGRCECVGVDFPIEAAFMASDGFHPSEAAYALWAERLVPLIHRRFSSGEQVQRTD